jgi:hypothetical protein
LYYYTAFSNDIKVSIPLTIAQSLLLPAYGSYKSESYMLSSFQLCMDLAPVFLLLTSDWSGEKGMGILFLPFFWAANRILAVPLNGFAAYVHNYHIAHKDPVRFLPTFSDRAHAGFIVTMGSDYSVPSDNGGLIPGILFKSGPVRTLVSVPPFALYGSEEYARIDQSSGFVDPVYVKYRSGAHLTAAVDYRLRVHKCACVNPGLAIDLFESKYSRYRVVDDREVPLNTAMTMSYKIGPKVSLEITRFHRFTVEQTVFLPVIVEKDFGSYMDDIGWKMPPAVFSLSFNMLIF